MIHNNDFNSRLKVFEDDYLRSRNQMVQLAELLFKLLNMLEDLEKRIKVLEEKHQSYSDKHHENRIINRIDSNIKMKYL